jgi:hypothetical protein
VTSNKKKGQLKELLAQHELEADGWRVIFRSMTVRLGPIFRGLDVADCIDIIAVKSGTWRLISCTHHGGESTRRRSLLQFAEEHGLQGMNFQLWAWYKAGEYGRGKNRKWEQAHFFKESVWSGR